MCSSLKCPSLSAPPPPHTHTHTHHAHMCQRVYFVFYLTCCVCSQAPTSTTELSTMLLPRPSSVQGSVSRGRALSAASYLTDAMEGEKQGVNTSACLKKKKMIIKTQIHFS